MATIKDVAKLANVSVATVSRFFNNGYISKDAKERVLKAIEQLNYSPNMMAQGLNHKKSNTIALVIPDITNPYFPELARSVEDVASENGYSVLLFNSDEEDKKIEKYVTLAQQKYIDGIILASPIKNYQDVNIPVVVLDRVFDKGIDSVVSNNKKGGRLATKYLLDTGCQKVAHIRGPLHTNTARERYEGYLESVQKYSWFHNDLIVDGNFDMKSAQQETYKLLSQITSIDGIFAGNDLMAVGAIKAIKELKLNIPEDISLIGFDGIALSQYVEPELSTIAQPIYNMGALSTKVLLDKIKNPLKETVYHELDVSIILRDSTRNRKR